MTIAIALILLLSCCFGSIIFYSPVCIVESRDDELMAKISDESIVKTLYSVAGIFLVSSTLMMLICYGLIFRVLAERKKKSQKVVIVGQNFIVKAIIQRNREGKLLKMSIIIFLTQLSITVFIIVKFMFKLDAQNFVYNQLK